MITNEQEAWLYHNNATVKYHRNKTFEVKVPLLTPVISNDMDKAIVTIERERAGIHAQQQAMDTARIVGGGQLPTTKQMKQAIKRRT